MFSFAILYIGSQSLNCVLVYLTLCCSTKLYKEFSHCVFAAYLG